MHGFQPRQYIFHLRRFVGFSEHTLILQSRLTFCGLYACYTTASHRAYLLTAHHVQDPQGPHRWHRWRHRTGPRRAAIRHCQSSDANLGERHVLGHDALRDRHPQERRPARILQGHAHTPPRHRPLRLHPIRRARVHKTPLRRPQPRKRRRAQRAPVRRADIHRRRHSWARERLRLRPSRAHPYPPTNPIPHHAPARAVRRPPLRHPKNPRRARPRRRLQGPKRHLRARGRRLRRVLPRVREARAARATDASRDAQGGVESRQGGAFWRGGRVCAVGHNLPNRHDKIAHADRRLHPRHRPEIQVRNRLRAHRLAGGGRRRLYAWADADADTVPVRERRDLPGVRDGESGAELVVTLTHRGGGRLDGWDAIRLGRSAIRVYNNSISNNISGVPAEQVVCVSIHESVFRVDVVSRGPQRAQPSGLKLVQGQELGGVKHIHVHRPFNGISLFHQVQQRVRKQQHGKRLCAPGLRTHRVPERGINTGHCIELACWIRWTQWSEGEGSEEGPGGAQYVLDQVRREALVYQG